MTDMASSTRLTGLAAGLNRKLIPGEYTIMKIDLKQSSANSKASLAGGTTNPVTASPIDQKQPSGTKPNEKSQTLTSYLPDITSLPIADAKKVLGAVQVLFGSTNRNETGTSSASKNDQSSSLEAYLSALKSYISNDKAGADPSLAALANPADTNPVLDSSSKTKSFPLSNASSAYQRSDGQTTSSSLSWLVQEVAIDVTT